MARSFCDASVRVTRNMHASLDIARVIVKAFEHSAVYYKRDVLQRFYDSTSTYEACIYVVIVQSSVCYTTSA